jgi:hypothetical protein
VAITASEASQVDQVAAALKQGYAITPLMAGAPQDPTYLEVIRQMAIEAVYSVWNQHRRPAHLWEIYHIVMAKIEDKLPSTAGLPWRGNVWERPSKRTVDRRVNEAADPRFYQDVTPLVAVSPGHYMPNPRTFDGQTRIQLEKLLAK